MAGKIFGVGGEDEEQDKTRIRINLTDKIFEAADRLSFEEQKKIQELASKRAKEYADMMSQVSPNVSSEDAFRSMFGFKPFDASGVLKSMIDAGWLGQAQSEEIIWKAGKSVERVIWQTALEIWDYPSKVRFTVWRDNMQEVTLFTAEYLDPEQESDEPLVKGTVQFTDEHLLRRSGGDLELVLQRELEKLKDNCDADMAAFEPDHDGFEDNYNYEEE